MAKAMGLIFSLFDIASAREVPFGILQYIQCIHGLTSVLLCVPFILLRVKSIDLVVAHGGFICVMEIVRIFHSGYDKMVQIWQLLF